MTAKPWLSRLDNQLFLLLLALAAGPLLYGLGRPPIRLWDESRLAVNASEMARNGHWLVTYFDGRPDLWNTKPPLLIWLQALGIRALGHQEWAIRWPTAAASLLTVSLLYWFCARTLRNPVAGLAAGLVLATSTGYLSGHVARSGDYDALLVLWQAVLWTAVFRYGETARPRDCWLAALGLAGALLTKSSAALLGLPALGLYLLGRQRLEFLLRQRVFYAAAAAVLLVVGGYYGLREHAAPGYWHAVQANELQGRYAATREYLAGPWNFYLLQLKREHFLPWAGLLPAAAVLAWRQPPGAPRRALVLGALFSAGWLAAISGAATKAAWYAAPVYPALALAVGLGLAWAYAPLRRAYAGARWPEALCAAAFAGLVFGLPYYNALANVRTQALGAQNPYRDYLQTLARRVPRPGPFVVLAPDLPEMAVPAPGTAAQPGPTYNPVFQYYRLALQAETPLRFRVLNLSQAAALQPADTVVLCAPLGPQQLEARFALRVLHQAGGCQTVVVTGRK